jgi:hypothetical protein
MTAVRVSSSAVSDHCPGILLAGSARPQLGIEGHGDRDAMPRGNRPAPRQVGRIGPAATLAALARQLTARGAPEKPDGRAGTLLVRYRGLVTASLLQRYCRQDH